ncbi:Sphingosine hydroxylase [Mycena indigotica]|uniref:Sphingosine hydroxylase n=1 Tax=Mycena indigotica TaxID=2126181 RepID=A0A8H6WEN5_9AGAR|nr:Sphingosine hydroxylase [Mycena indigotica]KAF7309654.1 Sphingosine hydroxylase [Mycena indigotica]
MTFSRPSTMNTTNCVHFVDGLCVRSSNAPWYYSYKVSLIDGVSDQHLALGAPVVAYWLLSLAFHYLDTREWKALKKYRLHDSPEVASTNQVTRAAVIRGVIVQQILQTALGLFWVDDKPHSSASHAEEISRIAHRLAPLVGSADGVAYWVYWWAIPIIQFLGAVFLVDTWQYFIHRYMHINKFLYRKVHSWHHRLYVPYAFGALYNHPLEALLLDSLGTALAETLTGMSTRQAALLFTTATLKTVDDHCGYNLPFDPLQMLSSNNADYHDIHHQKIGIKSNFSQPFFMHWDAILGTQMTRQEMEQRRQKARVKVE